MAGEKENSWLRRCAAIAGVFLGAVLLVAVWAKVREPAAFLEQIRLEGLDFWMSATSVTLIALALEAGLGVALVLGVRRLWLLIPAALLVAFFIFLTGRNYWLVTQGLRDPEASCGCFGTLLERTPAEAFWQDLLLLVPPLLLTFWKLHARAAGFPWKRMSLSLAAALAVSALAWSSSDLQFSGAAARIASVAHEEIYVPAAGYVLRAGGKVAGARIYQSEASSSLLIESPELSSPVLLVPRTRQVQRVDALQIRKDAQGNVHLPGDVAFPVAGEFGVTGKGIEFELNERRFELAQTPPERASAEASG